MPLQAFIVEGQFLGTAERSKEFWHSELVIPQSYLWMCPKCGETWARAPIEGQRWQCWSMPCQRHGTESFCGGSLILPLKDDFNKALPVEVMRREFDLHLKWKGMQ